MYLGYEIWQRKDHQAQRLSRLAMNVNEKQDRIDASQARFAAGRALIF
jgi:hypothetical protein